MTAVNSRDRSVSPFLNSPAASSFSSSSFTPPIIAPRASGISLLGCSSAHVKCIEAGLVDTNGTITDTLRDTEFPALPPESLARIRAERNRIVHGTTTLEKGCAHFTELYGSDILAFEWKGSFVFWAMGKEGVDTCLGVFGLSLSALGLSLENLKKPEDIDFEILLKNSAASELNVVLLDFQEHILKSVAKKGINCRVSAEPWYGQTSCSMTLSPISTTPVDFFIYHHLTTTYLCAYNALKLPMRGFSLEEPTKEASTLMTAEDISPWQALFDRLLQIVRPHKTINDHGWMKIVRDMSIAGFQVKDSEVWSVLQRYEFSPCLKSMEEHFDSLIQHCEEFHPSGFALGPYYIVLQAAAFMEDRIEPRQRAVRFQKYQEIPKVWRPIQRLLTNEQCSSAEIFALLQWGGILWELYHPLSSASPLAVRLVSGTGTLSIRMQFAVTSADSSTLQLCKSPEEAYDLLLALVSRPEYAEDVFSFLSDFLLAQPLEGNHKSEILALWRNSPQSRILLRKKVLAAHAQAENAAIKVFNFLILLALYAAELGASKDTEILKQRGGVLLEMFPAIYVLEGVPKKTLEICFQTFFGEDIEPVLRQFSSDVASSTPDNSVQVWVEAFMKTDTPYAVLKLSTLILRLKGKIAAETYAMLMGRVLEKMQEYFPQDVLPLWKWCTENDLYLHEAYFPLFCRMLFPFTDSKSRDFLQPYLQSLGKTLRQFLTSATLSNTQPFSHTASLYQLVDALSVYPRMKKRILDQALENGLAEKLFGRYLLYLYPETPSAASSSVVSIPKPEPEKKVLNLAEALPKELLRLKNRETTSDHMELVRQLSQQELKPAVKDLDSFILLSFMYVYPHLSDTRQKDEYVAHMLILIPKATWAPLPSDFKFKCDTRQIEFSSEILFIFFRCSLDSFQTQDGVYWLNLYLDAMGKGSLYANPEFIPLFLSWLQMVATNLKHWTKAAAAVVRRYRALNGPIVLLEPLFTQAFVMQSSLDCLSLLSCEEARELLKKPIDGERRLADVLLKKLLMLKHLTLQQWGQCLLILSCSLEEDVWIEVFQRIFSGRDFSIKEAAFQLLKNSQHTEWMSLHHKARISCWELVIKTPGFINLELAVEWLQSPETLCCVFSSAESGRIDSEFLEVYSILLEIVARHQHEHTQLFLSRTYTWLAELFGEKENLQAMIQFEQNLLRILQDANEPLELVALVGRVELRLWTPKFVGSVSDAYISLLRALCFLSYQHPNMDRAVTRLCNMLSKKAFDVPWVWNLFLTQIKTHKSFFTVSTFFHVIRLHAKKYLDRGFHVGALKNEREIVQGISELILHSDVRSYAQGRDVASILNSSEMQQFFCAHSESLVRKWLDWIFAISKIPERPSNGIEEPSAFFIVDAMTLAMEFGQKLSISGQKRLWYVAIKAVTEVVGRHKERAFYAAQNPMVCALVLCIFPFQDAVFGSDHSLDYCDRIGYLIRDLIQEKNPEDSLSMYGFIAEIYIALVNKVSLDVKNPFVGFVSKVGTSGKLRYGAEIAVDKLGKMIDAFLFETPFFQMPEHILFLDHLHPKLINAYYELFMKTVAAHGESVFYRPLLEMKHPESYILRLSSSSNVRTLRRSISLFLNITKIQAIKKTNAAIDFDMDFIGTFLKLLTESLTKIGKTPEIDAEVFRSLFSETGKLLKTLNTVNDDRIKALSAEYRIKMSVIGS